MRMEIPPRYRPVQASAGLEGTERAYGAPTIVCRGPEEVNGGTGNGTQTGG
jgi:hypothetical protein